MERHGAAKRAIDREKEPDPGASINLDLGGFSREPSPEDAAVLNDEMEQLLSGLKPHHRQMVELRLQGFSTIDIGEQVKTTDRQVRNVLEAFGSKLQERLQESSGL